MGLIGKQKSNLGANDLAVGPRTCGPLLTGDSPATSLNDKIVKVVPSHELHHLYAKLVLLVTELLDLPLKSANLIVNANPRPEGLAYFVCHCIYSFASLKVRTSNACRTPGR
jgi:hypothetical protein